MPNAKQLKKSTLGPDIRRFRSVGEAFLEESFRLFPHQASELGLTQFEAELGLNTAAVHRAYGKLLRETLAVVESLPEFAFRGDDWLDRRAFLSMLRTSLYDHEVALRWQNNPQIHCDAAIQAIFGPVVRHADDLRRGLPAIESRLARLPAFLAAGASCVRKPVPLWARLAQKTCAGTREFLSGLEKELAAVSERPARLAKLIAAASKAFDDFARTIARRVPVRRMDSRSAARRLSS